MALRGIPDPGGHDRRDAGGVAPPWPRAAGRLPTRAELTGLPCVAWPEGLPAGELFCQWRYDRPCDRYLVVTRADPLLLISDELLQQVYEEPTIHARLDMETADPPPESPRGAVFHIYADNGHWAYRLLRYAAPVNGWVAQWPD